MAMNEAKAQVNKAQAPSIPIFSKWAASPTFKELVTDIWNDNPIFRMVLALCPTMGATNMAVFGFTQGVATMFATAMSSITISLIRNFVPSEVRIAAYMVVIAAYVSVVDLVLKAFLPPLADALGPFVPLIITNCFVLGRAEAFASKNGPLLSFVDAIGVGLGFTLSLTLIGIVREILGFGSVFNMPLFGDGWTQWVLMIVPAGAFITVGLYIGLVRQFSPGGSVEET
jgi:electron transport complex protein RnfE